MSNIMNIYKPAIAITLITLMTSVLFCVNDILAQDTSASAKTSDGLHTVSIDTTQGKIEIYLPDDMSAGDTISGIVVAEPAGSTDEERNEHSDELNGYVVDIEVQDKEIGETSVKKGQLKEISIPRDLSPGKTKITLTDPEGRRVITTEIPVQDSPHPLQYTDPPSSKDYKLPYVAIAGEPIQVMGPFDGTFGTTAVKIGGKKATILAESPRKVVVQTPSDISGPAKIEVLEKGVQSNGEIYIADQTSPAKKINIDGIWKTESGKSSWRITQSGQAVNADSVQVPEEDEIRGYEENVNAIRGTLKGNLLIGQIQQFFNIPIKECMSMCPSKCEQWNDLKVVLSDDGNTLKGQLQEKVINTESCAVIEFGWRPWTMLRDNN